MFFAFSTFGKVKKMERWLPEELLLHIFQFLPICDVLQVSHTCGRWRRLAIPIFWKNPVFCQKVRLKELIEYPIQVLHTADIWLAAGLSLEIVEMLKRMNLKKLIIDHSAELTLRDVSNMKKLICPITIDSTMLREAGYWFERVMKCIRKQKYSITFSSDDYGAWSLEGVKQFVGLEIEKISPENICFWYDNYDDYMGTNFVDLMLDLKPLELCMIGGGCCGMNVHKKHFKKLTNLNIKQISTNVLCACTEDGNGYFPWDEFLLFEKLEMLVLERGSRISMQQLIKLGIKEVAYPEEELVLRGGIEYIWKFLEYKEVVLCEIINLSTEMKNTYIIDETINLHFKMNVVNSFAEDFDVLYFRT